MAIASSRRIQLRPPSIECLKALLESRVPGKKLLPRELKGVKKKETREKNCRGSPGEVRGLLEARFVLIYPGPNNNNGTDELHCVGDVNCPGEHEAVHKTSEDASQGRANTNDGRAHKQEAPGVGLHASLGELAIEDAHDGVDGHKHHARWRCSFLGYAEE